MRRHLLIPILWSVFQSSYITHIKIYNYLMTTVCSFPCTALYTSLTLWYKKSRFLFAFFVPFSLKCAPEHWLKHAGLFHSFKWTIIISDNILQINGNLKMSKYDNLYTLKLQSFYLWNKDPPWQSSIIYKVSLRPQ